MPDPWILITIIALCIIVISMMYNFIEELKNKFNKLPYHVETNYTKLCLIQDDIQDLKKLLNKGDK